MQSTLGSRRVLVTGSSGFIGTNVVEALLDRGNSVLGIDRVSPKNTRHAQSWNMVDLLNIDALRTALLNFRPDTIIHLGARTDLDGATVEDYRANHVGTRNLMEAANDCTSVEKVVFASTRLVNHIGYEPNSDTDYCPTTAYGESKVLGEKIVREANDLRYTWCIVRPTSIWGPWFNIPYRTFFDSVLAGRYVHPKGQRVYKSFGYIGNVVFELLSLIDAPCGRIQGGTFYLADYEPIEVYSFAKEIARQAGRGNIREVPFAALKIGALVGDALKLFGLKNPPLTSFRLSNLVTQMRYDMANLAAITGTLPYSNMQGINKTLLWMAQ